MKGVERHWFPLSRSEAEIKRSRSSTSDVKTAGPIDPLTGPKFALAGRVVTMNDDFMVVDDGVIYVDRGSIVAVQRRADEAPVGFADTAVLDTGGSIYPGLIELHNHLGYNALGLWSPVPKLYTDRGHFIEYDVLVREMPRVLRAAYIDHEDLFAGKWQPHLQALLDQPPPPERPRTDGSAVAAGLLAGMMERL